MNKTHKGTRKGFTLLEILLVIAAIGILAAIVLVAINPNKQIEAARSAKRRADINTIQKAIQQYSIDNNGQYPTGIETGAKAICRGGAPVGCIDLSSILAPTYLASIPEPDSNYYYVRRSNNSIEVSHPRDDIWNIGGNPSLDLNFASNKSLIDSVSGNNLVTFTRAAIPGVVDTDGSEAGDLPTSGRGATYFDSDRVMRYSSPNTARFDHNPLTGESLGLLVEESRTNLLLRSEEFDNASWIRFGTTTLTANTSVAPDGTTTGDNIAFTSASAGTYQIVSGSASTTYTFSVWVKSSASTQIRLVINTNLSDPTTQTVTVSTGWNRFSIIKTTAVGTTLVAAQLQDTGSGNTQFDIWGAQLEVGAFPTSYIPTTTSTVTRAADVASISGSNFSSWYRQDEGTVYVSAVIGGASNETGIAGLANAGETDFLRLSRLQTTSRSRSLVFDDSAAQADTQPTNTITVGQTFKLATAMKQNDFSTVLDSGAAAVDTSGTMLTVDRMTIGTGTFLTQLNGHIRRLTYFPQRISNANLQRITQ